MSENIKKCKLEEEVGKKGLQISRRGLLQTGAMLGASALVMSKVNRAHALLENISSAPAGSYPLAKAENSIYSVCLQCHNACPIKVKILDGVAVKIDGNPYSAQNLTPNLAQKASPNIGARVDAKLCPKGQAGVQSLYDPYRLVKVLKRKGPRGANKWETISFNKAINEIVTGGKLFSHIGEDRVVTGLKDIHKLKDAKAAKAMAKDAKAVASGKMKVGEFKSRHKANLGALINQDHPDLGPVNNQFIMQCGRIEHGRKELAKRFVNGGFGSVNFYEHTTICEQSHHIAYNESTKQYKDGKWGHGKHHMKPDSTNSEFIVYFGTGFAEANFGPTNMAEKVTDGLISGRLKVAVIDPRMSKSAAKAWKWLPVKPGTDAALALAMIQWIIANKRYDGKYLTAANNAAGKVVGETTWSNATHLVKVEKDGPGKLLRASEIGMGGDEFVVVQGGKPIAVGKDAVSGDLDFSGKIQGIKVKSAFTILKEEAGSNSAGEWSEICGIPSADIEAVAREFTAHGKKAGAEMYRGPVQHTNGYYNGQAIIALNTLIGNIDHKGGMMVGGGHWHEDGSKLKKPFNDKKLHPGKLASFGHKISREKSSYEHSTLFEGYPAKRPWFPFSGNVYQEIIPSAADQYPYGAKAIWLHKGTPGFAAPAGQTALEILADPNKIPLFFATDIVIGETSMYADYIFPDAAIWERWGTPHTSPDVPQKASKIRQPTVEPLTEVVKVFGEKQHCSWEAVLLAIAEQLDLPGFGKNGFGNGFDFNTREDFFLKRVANLAMGDKNGQAVPDASRDEMKLFGRARRHLSKVAYTQARWEKAVGAENWAKVVYILNRGGRWEDWSDKFVAAGTVVHTYKHQMNLYAEAVAKQKHSLTGKRFSGTPIFEPILDAGGKAIKERGYGLKLISYKEILGGQSRTLPTDYWLSALLPENFIMINTATAAKLGFKDGDMAKLVSASNTSGEWQLPNRANKPMTGRIKAVEGIRPGVVAVSWSFGHWGYGASDAIIDGRVVKGDKRRQTGLCPNAAMQIDPVLKNSCMTDPIGASASFYDTNINLERA